MTVPARGLHTASRPILQRVGAGRPWGCSATESVTERWTQPCTSTARRSFIAGGLGCVLCPLPHEFTPSGSGAPYLRTLGCTPSCGCWLHLADKGWRWHGDIEATGGIKRWLMAARRFSGRGLCPRGSAVVVWQLVARRDVGPLA